MFSAVLPLVFLIFIMPGCDGPTSSGQTAKAPAAPTPVPASAEPRLVVLSPALAITLRDLHIDRWIVGRHAYDMILDKSVPICGDQANIDYEALLKAKPTHILIEWGRRDLPARLTDLAKRNGWRLSNYEMLTLDQIRDSTRRLYQEFVIGEALSPAMKAAAQATPGEAPPPPWPNSEIARAMDRAWSKHAGPDGVSLARAGRVLVLDTVNPAHALGPGSFHYQIITAVGGMPVPEKGAAYIEMDAEDVLHLAPDAIIFIESRNPEAPPRDKPWTWDEIAAKLGPLARLEIPAIKNRRAAVIDDPLALMPSTSMIKLAEDIAKLLAEWSEPAKPGQ